MRKFTARIYTPDNSWNRYFDVVIDAIDYWDARTRLEAQYPNLEFRGLCEC